MARRQHLTLMVLLAIVGFLSLTYMLSDGGRTDRYPISEKTKSSGVVDKDASKADLGLPSNVLTGGSIAPKLENATAKAELGRASWKLFHTMMARFPEQPTADDSLALKTYIQLFARLYPCGQCAAHFQKMLKQYPPQTSSRNAAAGWACFVHNEVNKRLHKPEFNCDKLGDFYDCGCGDDKGKKTEGDSKEGSSSTTDAEGKGGAKGSEGVEDQEEKAVKAQERSETGNSVTLEKEGLTRGG